MPNLKIGFEKNPYGMNDEWKSIKQKQIFFIKSNKLYKRIL